MFEDERNTWREVTGKRVLCPAPTVPDPGIAPRLHAALSRFLTREPRRYRRFWLLGLPLLVTRRERALFAALERNGLATRLLPWIYAPRVRLFPLHGKLIATDLLGRVEEDQVFSLMLEQVYLVRNLGIRPGDRVLELGIGSGVNSLFAADTARSVTGVDRNPRALEYSRLNSTLNGQAGALELLEGDLYEPVAGRRFDLILFNPPFELVPEGSTWFAHSHGGEDGLDVVRRFLPATPKHLAPAGRLEMITWTPASHRGPEILPMLEETFPDASITLDIVRELPLTPEIRHFEDTPGYEGFRARLAARGLDRLLLVLARVRPSGTAAVETHRPQAEIRACEAICREWE